jgi:hypothetical protein
MLNKLTKLFFLICMLNASHAHSQSMTLDAAHPIKHLTIQAGVVAYVSCGSQPNLNLHGISSFLADVTYHHQDNTLLIDAHQNGGAIHSSTFITANIEVNSTIQSLEIQRGGFVTLDACVVDKNELSLNLQLGAHVYVNGHTKKLSVHSSMGGFLNKDGNNVITAEHGFVHCTQGCILKMGQMEQISGHVMLGGQIYIPASTKRVGLNTGIGGKLYLN